MQKETGEFEKTIWFLQFFPYTEAVSMDEIIEETREDTVGRRRKYSTRNQQIEHKDHVGKLSKNSLPY